MSDIPRWCSIWCCPEPEGGFSSWVPQLPGCVSQGETESQAIRNCAEALIGLLDSYEADGEEVPWVTSEAVTTNLNETEEA